MSKNYDPEFKAWAVRLVQQQRSDYPSMTAVCHAVESIVRVLGEQGVAIAARTYRHAKSIGPSPRTVSDA